MESATGASASGSSSSTADGGSTAAARAKLSDPTPAALIASPPLSSSEPRNGQQIHSKHEQCEQEQEHTFDALAYEQQNVHAVYNAIAPHFSLTRYKPWPLVPAFLDTFQAGSVGADLGAGNGKYLPCASVLHGTEEEAGKLEGKGKGRLLTIGSDRSDQLIELAYTNSGHAVPSTSTSTFSTQSTTVRNEVTVADALTSNFRSQRFDYAISIAAIHHFSTRKRRIEAVQEMIRLLRPVPRPRFGFHGSGEREERGGRGMGDEEEQYGDAQQYGAGPGRFMIYAWAMEQRGEGRRAGKFDAQETSTKTEEEKPQDVLVPWVLSQSGKKKEKDRDRSVQEGAEAPPVYQRCEPSSTTGLILTHPADPAHALFFTDYHLFKQGELEELVQDAASSFASSTYAQGCAHKHIRVIRQTSGWEKGNWWGIWAVHEA